MRKILRPVYFAAGVLLVGLGIIGIFVPLMPTTTFLILAAWCFARSSKRAETWLLTHSVFGPPIVAWRREGAIARKYKVLSVAGMSVGFALFCFTARPSLWLALVVGAVLLGCALFAVTRPEPSSQPL